MNNKDFAMLVIAVVVLAVAASGNMTMLTPSSSVTVYSGETITVPWKFIYDDSSFFGATAKAYVVQDEYQFGGSDRDIWSGMVTAGQIYEGSYDYTVPSVLGTYCIDYRVEYGSSRTTSGKYRLTINVVERPPEPVPTPTPTPTVTEASGDGTTTSYTDLGDEVEAVILDGSVWDKFRMFISLVLLYISDLLGGV